MNRRDVVKTIATMAIQPFLPALGDAHVEKGPDPLELVHPELRAAAAAALRETRSRPSLTLKSLPTLRAAQNGTATLPSNEIPCEVKLVPGVAGQPPVTIYVINGGTGKGRPAILHTHGGGFVFRTALMGVPALQELASELECVIVTVEYRLAPETTYKGSIDDNYTGLKWLHGNAAALGVDRSRIAVLGESAGGAHAALLAMAARDRGEIPIAFQCLIYPMLDDRTGITRPVQSTAGQLVWTASNNRFGWKSFLGIEPGTKDVPTAAVPARVARLEGLPPTFIAVGSIDLFFREDIEFAQRLLDAGIATELHVFPGAFHGFDLFPEARDSGIRKLFKEAQLAALRRGLTIRD